jgi:hypothetical protein
VQIPEMVEIFRGATIVLAWLHNGNGAVEQRLCYLDHLSRHPSIPPADPKFGDMECSVDRSEMMDVRGLTDLPHFKRLWIVQEVVLSLDIIMICGKIELSWLRLTKGLINIQDWRRTDHIFLSDVLSEMADAWQKNYTSPDLDVYGDEPKVLSISSIWCTI